MVSLSMKKTVTVRVHLDTHQRLRRVKHELEKESFDEALTALLDEHEDNKKKST